jgi:hypothetical protein
MHPPVAWRVRRAEVVTMQLNHFISNISNISTISDYFISTISTISSRPSRPGTNGAPKSGSSYDSQRGGYTKCSTLEQGSYLRHITLYNTVCSPVCSPVFQSRISLSLQHTHKSPSSSEQGHAMDGLEPIYSVEVKDFRRGTLSSVFAGLDNPFPPTTAPDIGT